MNVFDKDGKQLQCFKCELSMTEMLEKVAKEKGIPLRHQPQMLLNPMDFMMGQAMQGIPMMPLPMQVVP